MKKVLKVLFVLCVLYSIINIVSCNEIELSCSGNEDCKSFSDKLVSSNCNSTKMCECTIRESNQAVTCTPKVTKVSNVESSNPCIYPNTEFKNGTCVTKVVMLGKACDDSKQCFKNDKNSECIKGICDCKENFIELEKVCRSTVELNKNCSNNVQCIENAVCHEEKCVCNKNFISSSDFTKCLPFVAYKDKCSENRQCEMILGYGAICDESICKCNKGYSAIMNEKKEFECQKKIQIGDSCNDDLDCSNEINPAMTCEDKKCKCSNGHELIQVNGENMCVKETKSALPEKSTSSGAASLSTFKILCAASFIACFFY